MSTDNKATNGQQNTAAENQNTVKAVVIAEKNIADSVMNKVKVFEETGTLNLPKDYSAANAIRAAWLILQETKTLDKRPVLEACTKDSVANSLFKMVTQGLNPVKRQCSFIAYGNRLECQREYAGTIHIAKRDAGVVSVIASAIFKDDEFAFEINPETGERKITKHIQTIESIGSKELKGAYAIITYGDGRKKVEIMSMSQIMQAWQQGATKGQSPAHKNFPDQMACKTAINRALKIDVNSSDDAAMFDETDQPAEDVKIAHVKQQVNDNANRLEAGFEETEKFDTETGEILEPKTEQQQQSKTKEEEKAPY